MTAVLDATLGAAMRAAGSWANSAVSTESTCSISIFLRELRMISGHRKLFQAPRKAKMVMVPMAGLMFGTTTCQ